MKYAKYVPIYENCYRGKIKELEQINKKALLYDSKMTKITDAFYKYIGKGKMTYREMFERNLAYNQYLKDLNERTNITYIRKENKYRAYVKELVKKDMEYKASFPKFKRIMVKSVSVDELKEREERYRQYNIKLEERKRLFERAQKMAKNPDEDEEDKKIENLEDEERRKKHWEYYWGIINIKKNTAKIAKSKDPYKSSQKIYVHI